MAGLNINDVVSVSYRGRVLGQRTVNTLHYRITTASTNANTLAALSSWGLAYSTGPVSPTLPLLAAMPQNWVLEQIRVQRVYPVRSAYIDFQDGRPGQIAVDAETTNINATITKRTPSGTRNGIGSFHAPAMPADGFLNGQLTAAYDVLTNAYAVRFINPFTDAVELTQGTPIVYNRAFPGLSWDLTSTIVQQTLRVMRRRTVGVGE